MKLANKISKRLDFLTSSYGFSCVQNTKETICFSNDKTTITFEYDAHRHEYFDELIEIYAEYIERNVERIR